ncbi:MAG: cohesin domain-containing protein, partial [Pyrinomonadaceae bacterium]
GLEGDVTTRNAGNGTFEATDVVQMRRFVTGLDTPVATHNEYQRADVAPSNLRGDGTLNASDLVQVRRFVAGLDASQPAGGAGAPNPAPIAPPSGERPEIESEVLIGEVMATNNSRVRIPVDLRSNGSEVALSFTVHYDERKLSDPTVDLAAGLPDGVTLTTNAKEPGVIRILIDAATVVAYDTKVGQKLVDLGFKVLSAAPSGEASLDIEDLNVSDAAANSTPSGSKGGVIRIDGANPVETEAKFGGRLRVLDVDLVEEWLEDSIVILRPRFDGEVKLPVVQPGRRIDR